MTDPTIEQLAKRAREASSRVAGLTTETKNAVLLGLADRLEARAQDILSANTKDMDAARAAGLATPKLRRLELIDKSIKQLAEGVRQIAALPDPVGQVTRAYDVPSGLHVEKVRTPLGVIAMIYEARPGVTIDAFALCFKAGNACILKGGREANDSNQLLASIAKDALRAHGAPEDAITAMTSSDRDELRRLLTLSNDINLVIPRGGEPLIRFVHEHSRIPTIQHFQGVCHIYVDKAADLDRALDIVATAKTSAPATCNAAECVLIHQDVAAAFTPRLAERLARDGVELRGDERVLEIFGCHGLSQRASRAGAPTEARVALPGQPVAPNITPATDDDWGHEYLDLILAAKIVASMDDAIAHIERYSSDHTEAILTEDAGAADEFCRRVRSSCVLVNASTRFNDGFQLGLGAEIGISTSRIHAYGPMGLEGLTIERYVVRGSGQTR
ncbi:MAG: glutamate-5-semialdehyde dehydrogenase [Phycisphaerales bacterium]